MNKMTALKLEEFIPLEASESKLLMRWVHFSERKYPELMTFYHIPNGGQRTPQAGAMLKKSGVKKGMPDYCLPIARHGYNALYVELKRQDGGILSEAQQAVHDLLREWGNRVVVAQGWESAKAAILAYLENSNEAEHKL